jgi:hypothetical protein
MWIYGFSTKIVSKHKSISGGDTMICTPQFGWSSAHTVCDIFVGLTCQRVTFRCAWNRHMMLKWRVFIGCLQWLALVKAFQECLILWCGTSGKRSLSLDTHVVNIEQCFKNPLAVAIVHSRCFRAIAQNNTYFIQCVDDIWSSIYMRWLQ